MPEISDEFINVQFDEQPEYTFGDMGAPSLEVFSSYESVTPVMTNDEIDRAIEKMDEQDDGLEWMVQRIFDQKQEGSCVANACAQAHQIIQAKQFGPDRVIDLSAISLYKQIGRTAASGAMVSDGLEVICSKGILPLDTPKNRELFGSAVMPNTGFKERYPADWELTAQRFAGAEYHTAKTVNGLMTALCNRDPVIVGREGHSIVLVRPTHHKGNWATKYPNSWRETWGFALGNMSGGFGMDTISQIKKSAQYCFVLRSVNSPALA